MANYDLTDDDVVTMQRYAAGSTFKVTQQLERVDAAGNFLEDLTDVLVAADDKGRSSDNTVRHVSTDTAPGVFTFSTTKEMAWGADIVRPIMVLTVVGNEVPGYVNGDTLRWRLGAYVVSSPERDLVPGSTFRVTAYDKVYLLMADVGDTFSVTPDNTLTYAEAVRQLLVKANVLTNAQPLSSAVDYTTAWAAKKIPTTTDTRVWPSDDSNNFQYIEIVNALLKASGCRPLYTSSTGRYVIEDLPKPPETAPRWTFDRNSTAKRTEDDTLAEGNSRQNDVWNLPNQITYVQGGLTYDPIEGAGQFTINNHPNDPAHYRPGSDQVTVGRIIRSVRRLDASGQDDLKKLAEADYTETYANAETFTLATTSWPVAGHYDVFLLRDDNLPRINTRKVEATSWDLPLDGSAMTWNVRTVGDS